MITILIGAFTIFVGGCLIFRAYFSGFSHLLCVILIFSLICNILIEISFDIPKAKVNVHRINESSGHSDIPVVIWWTPFVRKHSVERWCHKKSCIFTENRKFENSAIAKAYLFYGSNINITDLPLPRKNKFWALFHEESVKNTPILSSKYMISLFNFTSTFSRYSHLPLTTLHLENINKITSMKYFIPTSEKNKLLDSIAPVLYIQSNCDTLTDRDAYVANLSQYVKIDSFGKCLNNAKLPESLNGIAAINADEFLHFVAKYKFTISIENAVCEDYITEKLWRPLIVGSVPMYFGSRSVRDWLPNYDSAILISDFSTPRELANYINLLIHRDDRYEQFLRHKIENKVVNPLLRKVLKSKRWYKYEELIDEFECRICTLLYENVESFDSVNENHFNCESSVSLLQENKSANNDWDIILRTGRCEGKAIFDFISKNVTFSLKDVQEKVKILMKNDC